MAVQIILIECCS